MSNHQNNATNAESLGLDHLRSFIAVVETGSQVRAARRLRVAQTTVSRHIERVQEHFGGGLFAAGSSGPLSARGLLIEQSARIALAELALVRERVAVERPVLRVGFIRPVRPLLEKALRVQTKGRGSPDFEVRLHELSSEAQARALDRRELDIALSYAIPALSERGDVDASLVVEEPFALVLPERAWIQGRLSVPVLRPLLHAYSPRPPSSELARAEQRWFTQHRLEPKVAVECSSGSEIIAYAGAGLGYGFLPALWSMASREGVAFAPIQFAATAKITAYSLHHVGTRVSRLRQDLSVAARAALRAFREA